MKNKTCIFINGTCVYRLVLSNWYFGTNPKEVCKGIRVTFLLIDYMRSKQCWERSNQQNLLLCVVSIDTPQEYQLVYKTL